MEIPINVILLMIITSINFALYCDKNNKWKYFNLTSTIIGFIVIFFGSTQYGL